MLCMMQIAEAMAKSGEAPKDRMRALSGFIAGNEAAWKALSMTSRAEALMKLLASD